MRGPSVGRFVRAVVVLLGISVALAGPVSADPAGPTDYQSEIVDLGDAADVVEARMIGGDSFLELTVEPGVEVIVVGYRGEPMLAFRPDGTVEENRASPSVVLNEDRYAETELPPGLSEDAEPVWEAVGSGGRYAWHDHRTHWMQRIRPPGRSPGDVILEAVVPLHVDGASTGISVRSMWEDGPSPLWAILGAAIAVTIVAVGRRAGRLPEVALGLAVATLALGSWATWSVPAETGPPRIAWMAPLVGALAAAAAVALRRRLDPVVASGLVVLAGVQLVLVGWERREVLPRAVVPTDAPWSLDRAVVAAALVGGAALLVVGALAVLRPVRPAIEAAES